LKTDLQRFVEFYEGVGITLQPQAFNDTVEILLEGHSFPSYPGCYSVVKFSKDGKFISQKFFE